MKKTVIASSLLLLCVSNAYSKVTYLHSNPLGSIVAATDETGKQLWVKRYTPYGTESEANGTVSDLGANHGFATHEVDKETGLVYMKARYYDPLLGRFLSTDAFGFQEYLANSFNPYLYGSNNPNFYIDKSGLVIEIGSVPAMFPLPYEHVGVIVTPNFPFELLAYRPDVAMTIMMNGGSFAMDAIRSDGVLSARGYDASYPWGNRQEVFPDSNSFNAGLLSSVSIDTLSITAMMDAYYRYGSSSSLLPYNALGGGNQNSWLTNQAHSYYSVFNDGGWNSNNFATSILDSGGIYSDQSMMPWAPSFGTSLPNFESTTPSFGW